MAAAAAAAVQVHVGCIKASTTQLLDSGLVRFPALSLSLVGEGRGRVVKWGGGGRGERKERGGGLVARLVAVVMDGFTGELEMEERVVGEEGVEQERCVKAVFFDLDDTLVLTHAADKVAQQAVLVLAERQVPHINGAEMVKVFAEKFDVSPWDRTHQVDVLEWRARIWNEALQSQGVDDMPLARDLSYLFDKERLLSFQWAPGVEAMVQSLHKLGIKMGVITNGHFSVQRKKLKACKADLLFDTMLVGGEEPNQKPHKDIFLKACKLAGCNPEETIMVGDNLKTDIQGGINAGFLATVWVNVHGLEGLPAGGATPDHVIANIGELPGLLKTLNIDLGSS
ncbi:hypothetical protein M758_8G075200 [Ceratodon purpureus]|nr:hypothetical protein M758_8G075200 [Ceratodon purpureus]